MFLLTQLPHTPSSLPQRHWHPNPPVLSLCFGPSRYGFQLASQVLVSADVAKGLPRRARWTALRAMRMAMLVASATALALWVGRESIAAALVRDPLATWQQVGEIGWGPLGAWMWSDLLWSLKRKLGDLVGFHACY